jgi:hypothetical protein
MAPELDAMIFEATSTLIDSRLQQAAAAVHASNV